jgi:hypothetical protein
VDRTSHCRLCHRQSGRTCKEGKATDNDKRAPNF